MAVIVDTVLLFQLLNVFERSFGMRTGNAITQRLAGVQEDFFQTAIQAHSFMLGKITEQSSQALLQSDPTRSIWSGGPALRRRWPKQRW